MAAYALGRIGGDSDEAQAALVDALGRIGGDSDEAQAALVDALADPDLDTRR